MADPFIETQYYEGILQLRNPRKEVQDYILKKVGNDNKAKISNIKKAKNGIDYYLTSQKYLLSLGKALHNQFGGELKTSRKIFTRNRQTSKDVYRVTVMLRLPGFKIGDIIKAGRDKVKVTAIGKKVMGISQETGKKVLLSYKQINQ